MKIGPIKTDADYDAALARIDRLMDAKPNTARGDELDILVTLVESYEARHWAIDPPDPIEAIKLRMGERGLSRRDLENILGSSGRVSEILNRKRDLTVRMMRSLHEKLDIPAESFFRPERGARARTRHGAAARERSARGVRRTKRAQGGVRAIAILQRRHRARIL